MKIFNRHIPRLAGIVVLAATMFTFTACEEIEPDVDSILFCDANYGTSESDIYSIKPDGSSLVQLTDSKAFEKYPNWSPDRTKIAFTSDGNLYTMNAQGKGVKELLYNGICNSTPIWSPDGGKIAFVHRYTKVDDSTMQTVTPTLWVVNADGTDLLAITTTDTFSVQPAWSPDSKKIVFAAGQPGNLQVCTINCDGTGFMQITDNNLHQTRPNWSPDGGKIAFVSSSNAICTVNADGTDLKILTDNNEYVNWPIWSPDGEKIVFLSGRTDHGSEFDHYTKHGLYVMNPDGSGTVKLGECLKYCPSWSPDSKTIAFISGQPDQCQLFTVNRDGTNLTRRTLIFEFSYVRFPTWSTPPYSSD